jgi:hypothetical protein
MCAFSINRRCELIANSRETIEKNWEQRADFSGAMQSRTEGLAIVGLRETNGANIAQFVGGNKFAGGRDANPRRYVLGASGSFDTAAAPVLSVIC